MNSENLSVDESRSVMDEIMTGQASPVQISAYLTALSFKGETVNEILGSAQAMRDKVNRIEHHQEKLFDNCGTGGDHSGTFNISTTVSFVIAGCGLTVAKHGNRSITSKCGSADLLQALGARIDLSPEQVGQCIDQIGIGFLFAPALHPAMKNVAPVRKELGFRTIFNILGPLTNPAFATHQLIGVFDGTYTEKLAEVARRLGVEKIFVVHSLLRVDELTTAGPNKVSMAENGTASSFQLNPEDFGFAVGKLEDLKGGSAEENAEITLSIMGGEKSPRRDTVLLNAGAALMVSGEADSIEEGIAIAADGIDSGRALEKLIEFINLTRSFKDAG
jgi:anthranilate phosphoribosyltransferase